MWFSGEESACQCRISEFDPWVGKIPWRRKRQPTPVFLPEKSHGQRSQAGYSLEGHKESDMTEQLHDWAGDRRYRWQKIQAMDPDCLGLSPNCAVSSLAVWPWASFSPSLVIGGTSLRWGCIGTHLSELLWRYWDNVGKALVTVPGPS